MRPRDAQRLLDAIGELVPGRPGSRDLSGEVLAALADAGKERLAADLLAVVGRMRGLRDSLENEAWEEHELDVEVDGTTAHVLLEENHGRRCGDITVEFPGDRTFSGTWSVGKAGPEDGGPSVLCLDVEILSRAEVAGIAQALVEECPGLGADTYQYPVTAPSRPVRTGSSRAEAGGGRDL